MNTDAQSAADARLRVLLYDYQEARSDERSLLAAQSTTLGIAVTLVAALVAVVTRTCRFQDAPCTQVPDLVLAFVPLAPLAILAFLLLQGTVSVVRSYYLRAIEDELQSYAGGPLPRADGAPAYPTDVGPGSYFGLTVEVTSLRLGRGRRSTKAVLLVILAAVLVIFGGLTVYIALPLPAVYQAAMLVAYGGATVLYVAELLSVTVGGRGFYRDVVESYARRGKPKPARVSRNERQLISYLALPRPEDTVKWLFLPVSYLVVAWSLGGSVGWDLLIGFVVLELLAYTARYQINDLRGLESDQEHGSREARGRLPLGPTGRTADVAVYASVGTTVLRLVVAGLVLAFVPDDTRRVLLTALVALLVYSIVYERLRSQMRVTAIWLLVGAGYAIRAATGAALAGLGDATLGLLGAVFWLFGIAFVTMTWALEALDFSYGRVPGEVYVAEAGRKKPHVIGLLRHMGASDVDASEKGPWESCSKVRGLQSQRSPGSPWVLSHLSSSTLAAVLGFTLAAGAALEPSWWSVTAAALGLMTAVVTTFVMSAFSLIVIAGGFAGQVALSHAAGGTRPLLSGVPLAVLGLVFVGFRSSSYDDLKHGFGRGCQAAASVIVATPRRAVGLLLGSGSREYLKRRHAATTTAIPGEAPTPN